jgi:predicted Zn-dependent peptidase
MLRAANIAPKRSFAVAVNSAISYKRAAEQPELAPVFRKTVSKASNGIKLATHDNFGPASSVAVYINAGSRYDNPAAPGVAHLLQRSLVRVHLN